MSLRLRLRAITAAVAVLTTVGSAALALPAPAAAASSGGCAGIAHTGCGVDAEPGAGVFHGLIAVSGEPWVFDTAARSGTEAGCGDCTWAIVLACPPASPSDPGSLTGCAVAARSGGCRRGQLLYRLYLSTDADLDQVVGTVCLGDGNEPVPVGAIATADVQRYLHEVRPPDLQVVTRPPHTTLAGLLTFFTARLPADVAPVPFGGPGVTETITIAPARLDWHWSDHTASGWVPPAATVSHTYTHGGSARAVLTTRWRATYTVTYQGETAGPMAASGVVTVRQQVRTAVRTSSPVLVSR